MMMVMAGFHFQGLEAPRRRGAFASKKKKTGSERQGRKPKEAVQEHGNRGGGRVEVILDCQEEGAEATIIIDDDTRRQVCACSQAPGLGLPKTVWGSFSAGRSDGGGVDGGHDGYGLSYLAPPLPARSPSFSTCSATSSSRSSSITTRVLSCKPSFSRFSETFIVLNLRIYFVRDVHCTESSNFVLR